MLHLKKRSNEAFIIDPTIRFETNNKDQAKKVDLEKRTIYEGCVPFLKEKYRERYNKFTVRGLLFGARGTIYSLTTEFFRQLGLEKEHLHSISENIIADSVAIIQHHVYKNI